MITENLTLALTQTLLKRSSITPEDGDCLALLGERLSRAGFKNTFLTFGDVKNLWSRRGDISPLFVFAGHVDVVPTGPLEKWTFPPFEAVAHEEYLYGRGAQDMKSNIAAMITACERFIAENPSHPGSIAFLLTSDEEGPSINGTQKVMEYLQSQNIHINYCIVGEPSSEKETGDTLKIGRRGTLSAVLTVQGQQGHIAYPQLADNPIHRALPCLTELIQTSWDTPYHFFEKTSLQISNLHAGTGANNVIPGELNLHCNFRYSPAVTADSLQIRFENILKKYGLRYTLQWHHSGKPFLTSQGKLVETCIAVIEETQKFTPKLSTQGGTSDGRFIAPTGSEVVEMGVCNDRIHQIDERVKISELALLSCLYEKILKKIL
jgi:succinyl-diaminopimelate desuccinylase